MNYLWKSLIGEETIISGDGSRHSFFEKFGNVKYIGLYFSASWCKPCQEFKDNLIQWFSRFKSNHGDSYFQILFVSSDESESLFVKNIENVPWFALPYEYRKLKVQLTKTYKVANIPALVIIERATNNVICPNARAEMLEDTEGKNFPWQLVAVKDLLHGSLLKGTIEVQAEDVLEGNITALYFSAHWCPPCREVSKVLENLYAKLRLDGKKFEVVYVSSDKSEKTFDDYYSTMPWLAIPFGDKRIPLLIKRFQLDGIPAVVLLDHQQNVITVDGRNIISEDPDGQDFPWPTKAVQELTSATASLLNHTTALVFFTGGKKSLIELAKNIFEKVSVDYKNEKSKCEELQELLFLYQGSENEDIANSLKDILRLEDDVPQLVVCDLPEQQYHLCLSEKISIEIVKQIVSDLKIGDLLFTSLGV